MASHAGLVYTIKTKRGYIGPEGTYVDDIKNASSISGYYFSGASELLRRFGYDETEGKTVTIEKSYDSRLGDIEQLLLKIGYSKKDWEYMSEAERIFEQYNCYEYQNYLECIENLNNKLRAYYKNKTTVDKIIVDGEVIDIKQIENNCYFKDSEYEIYEVYSDLGVINKTKYKIKEIPISKYFTLSYEEEKNIKSIYNGLVEYISNKLDNILNINIEDGELIIYSKVYNKDDVLNLIRSFYEENSVHITRMFGSYILITGRGNELKAVKATPIPIKYCPLMVKLLKEVGGEVAEELLKSLEDSKEEIQTELMCKLINEVVIKGGYFDTNRPLNSCEANVLFGASETISSAFESDIVDAAVIVSNNLGTIITTNSSNTQGAVKRMTGLFYTSPSEQIMDTAQMSGIIPVFPHTAAIDQIEGVKKAISLGYKKIAVSLAANENYLHEELKRLEETNGVTIYKFGLCSTGIDEKTSKIMRDNADVIWSCASKQVKEFIEPNALAQVGVKIPVHIMTKRGYEIIKNHLNKLGNIDFDNVEICEGEQKPVFINSNSGVTMIKKRELKKCGDCPHPCI